MHLDKKRGVALYFIQKVFLHRAFLRKVSLRQVSVPQLERKVFLQRALEPRPAQLLELLLAQLRLEAESVYIDALGSNMTKKNKNLIGIVPSIKIPFPPSPMLHAVIAHTIPPIKLECLNLTLTLSKAEALILFSRTSTPITLYPALSQAAYKAKPT